MKKIKQPSDLEIIVWEGAYKTLETDRPELLRLVSVLAAGGETPAQIFKEMKKRTPESKVFPALCANAANWIIYQSKNQ